MHESEKWKWSRSVSVWLLATPCTAAHQARVLEWSAIAFSVVQLIGYVYDATKKRCRFHHGGLECKSRRSRDTENNSQVWPWSTKWSRAKANSFVERTHWSEQTPSSNSTGHQGHHVYMDITRWSIPKSDLLYLQPKMKKLCTVSKDKTWSWLWLRSWTPYCKTQT